MNPFNLPSPPIIHEFSREIPRGIVVIEGAQLFHTLCPVSNLTKLPLDLESAIRMAINDPKLSGLASQIIQTLPSISSDSRLSDDDRLDLLISNYDLGTPAETDRVRSSLLQIVGQLFPKADELSQKVHEVADDVVTPVVEHDISSE